MTGKLITLVGLILLILTPFFQPYLGSDAAIETMIRTAHRGSAFETNFFKEIYQDKDDIDVLILESSQIQFSLDSALLHNLVLKTQSRKWKVVRFTIYKQGSEIQSLLAEEILNRRKIKLIAVELQNYNQPDLHESTCLHSNLPAWQNHLADLDIRFKITLFACSMQSGWRNLYAHLDHNIFPQYKVGNVFQPRKKRVQLKNTEPSLPINIDALWNYAQSIPIDHVLFNSANLDKIKAIKGQPDIEAHFISKILKAASKKGSMVVGLRPPIPKFTNGRITLNEQTQKLLAENHIPVIGLTPSLLLGTPHALSLNDIFISPVDWHTTDKGKHLSTLFYFRAFSKLLKNNT